MTIKNTFGLIGYPLGHSFSAGYFAKKFEREGIQNCEYINFPIEEIAKVNQLVHKKENLRGFNVTIPYKKEIIPFLNRISKEASEVGAVNTVKIIRKENQAELWGFNTDIYGFRRSLEHFNVSVPEKSLILGSGGAAVAVSWVLGKMGSKAYLVSRSGGKAENYLSYDQLKEITIEKFPLIINTTPLGMHPDVSQFPPIPYHTATSSHVFFDLIYNPSETVFLKKGHQIGCKTINGLMMLEQQAEKAWEIWNDPDLG